MASSRTQRVGRKRSQPTDAENHSGAGSLPAALDSSKAFEEEFARLAQREPSDSEQVLARSLLGGEDVWAEGHDPESIPTLAAAAAPGMSGPLLFLSPEAELLRTRQVRFGARAQTALIDASGAVEELEGVLRSLPRTGVIWCTLDSLQHPSVKKRLAELAPAAVVVESAHAASPLAHEVRASLSLLPALRSAWGHPSVLAFTRAARQSVRLDAQARLGLSAPRIERMGVAQGVRFSVVSRNGQKVGTRGAGAEEGDLVELLERLPRPTIVYCATPQQADAAYARLTAAQLPVHRYHGAMSPAERATEMLHFTLPGRRAVMIATSAFGPGSGLSGIDEPPGMQSGHFAMPEGLGLGYSKQKARSLVHLCAPVSLEQYAWELAVLGEGQTEAVVFFDSQQLVLQRALLGDVRLGSEQLRAVGDALLTSDQPINLVRLESLTGLGRKVVRRAVRLFEDAGVLVSSPSGLSKAVSPEGLVQIRELLAGMLAQVCEGDEARLEAVSEFCAGDGCRSNAFTRYFESDGSGTGERWALAQEAGCGRCDTCEEMRVRVGSRPSSSASREDREPAGGRHKGAPTPQRRAPARAWSVSGSRAEAPTVLVQKPRRSRTAEIS